MKQTLILLICLFEITDFTFGQSSDSLKTKVSEEVAIGSSIVQTSLLSKKFYGISVDIKDSPSKRIGNGLCFFFCDKKISDTFGYRIQKPIVEYAEIKWINQYNFLQKNRMRMNISLINGLSIAWLVDDAIRVNNHSKEIARNYFYLLEPGAGFSFKLVSNNSHKKNLWLTAETNYRFVFGHSKFGSTKQFSSYLFGIGILTTGF